MGRACTSLVGPVCYLSHCSPMIRRFALSLFSNPPYPIVSVHRVPGGSSATWGHCSVGRGRGTVACCSDNAVSPSLHPLA